MVFTIGLGDAIWSGRIPGASFFIMMVVIIKSSLGTIKQICFLLNYEVNNSYTVLNLIEIRKPYEGEKLTATIHVEKEVFDY